LRERGIAHRAIGQLARKVGVLERGLAGEVARLPRSLSRALSLDGLLDDRACVRGVLLQELRQPAVDGRLDEALHGRVAELGLGLPLELGILQLDRDDRREALADVLALEVLLFL